MVRSSRSGLYLYKPDVSNTCCPPYTIRLPVNNYVFSKSHKKTVKKMAKYLRDGDNASMQVDSIPAATSPDVPSREGLKEPMSDLKRMIKDGETVTPAHKHTLKVTLTPSVFEEDSYKLYKKYQMVVHSDKEEELTESKYTRFLVDTPLKKQGGPEGMPGYGSFHQKYYMDTHLVAVGYIDILPKCLSSVYFIYDPDLSSLSWGVYGSLREIMYTQSLFQSDPNIQYYYMGYYIHGCVKMKYKGQFKPSDLLCPETYGWAPLEKCVSVIEASPGSALTSVVVESGPSMTTEVPPVLVERLPAFKEGELVRVIDLKPTEEDREHLLGFVRRVGLEGVQGMVFVL